jgi:hypothetical protein
MDHVVDHLVAYIETLRTQPSSESTPQEVLQ